MKCNLTFLFFAVFSLVSLISCRKDTGLALIVEDKITYTYNGQQYTSNTAGCILSQLVGWQGGSPILGFYGLAIDNPAILGGKVWLVGSTSNPWNCGYLEPTGISVQRGMGNCDLRTNGGPIDSVAVYLYESGSLQISSNECTSGTGYCKVTGTFDVTLVNKNGQRIVLTNGSFSGNY